LDPVFTNKRLRLAPLKWQTTWLQYLKILLVSVQYNFQEEKWNCEKSFRSPFLTGGKFNLTIGLQDYTESKPESPQAGQYIPWTTLHLPVGVGGYVRKLRCD
jgi:hypothetical protein